MKILLSLTALTLALAACSTSQAQTATRPSSGTQAAATAAPPAPGTSGPAAPASASSAAAAASSNETCTFSHAGSGPGSTRIVSAAASDDTLTLTFDGGVPTFDVATQPSTRFILSPSGLPATLAGSAGVTIKFSGLTMGAYGALPKSFSTSGPLLVEVRNLQDFEGVVTFGAGLNASGCASAAVSGSTVTFHFLATGKG